MKCKKIILILIVLMMMSFSTNLIFSWKYWPMVVTTTTNSHSGILTKGYIKGWNKYCATGCYSFILDSVQPSCWIAYFSPMIHWFWEGPILVAQGSALNVVGGGGTPLIVQGGIEIYFACIILERVTRMERWGLYATPYSDVIYENTEGKPEHNNIYHCDYSSGTTNWNFITKVKENSYSERFATFGPVGDGSFLLHMHTTQDFYAHTIWAETIQELIDTNVIKRHQGAVSFYDYREWSRSRTGAERDIVVPENVAGYTTVDDALEPETAYENLAADMAVDATANVFFWTYVPPVMALPIAVDGSY